MKIQLPILEQRIENGSLISNERIAVFDLDPSVYSEERWEQNFPALAQKESLFEYIERVKANSQGMERVKVAAMLKAIYCFIESNAAPTYKDFARLFSFTSPEYTERLIQGLIDAFKIVTEGSAVKN